MSGYEFDAPQWLDLQEEAHVYRDEHHDWFRYAHAEHERPNHRTQQPRRRRRRSSLSLGLRSGEADETQNRGGLCASTAKREAAPAACHVMSRKHTRPATQDAEHDRLIQRELEKLKQQQQSCDSPGAATPIEANCPELNNTDSGKLASNSPTASKLRLQHPAATAKRLDSRVLRAVRESLSGSSPRRVGRAGLLATQAVHRCRELGHSSDGTAPSTQSPGVGTAPTCGAVSSSEEATPPPVAPQPRAAQAHESSVLDRSSMCDPTSTSVTAAKAQRRSLSTQNRRKQRRSLVASARSVLSMEGRNSPTTTVESQHSAHGSDERHADDSSRQHNKENSTQGRATVTAPPSRLRLLGSPTAVTRTAARTRRRSGLARGPIAALADTASTRMGGKDAKRRVAPSDMRDPRANPPAKTAATADPPTSSIHSSTVSATQRSRRRRSLRQSLVSAPSSSSSTSTSTTRAAPFSLSSSSSAHRPSSSRYNLRSSVRTT